MAGYSMRPIHIGVLGPIANDRDGYAALKMIDAFYRSAQTGSRVAIAEPGGNKN